jgi:hypothetical protein
MTFRPSKSADFRSEPTGFGLISGYDFAFKSLRNPQVRPIETFEFRNSTYAPVNG